MASLNNCAKDPTLTYEFALLNTSKTVIAIDEVGRGAIAGPVAAGVQVFTLEMPDPPPGIRDSKLLSEKRRTQLHPQVSAWGQGAVGMVSASVVDAQGVSKSLGEAGLKALRELRGVDFAAAVVLLDGNHNWLTPVLPPEFAGLKVVTKVGADRACLTVAAASIRAKVARDALMAQLAEKHPGYEWEKNKGYASKNHLAAIAQLGVSRFHRVSWVKPETVKEATLF